MPLNTSLCVPPEMRRISWGAARALSFGVRCERFTCDLDVHHTARVATTNKRSIYSKITTPILCHGVIYYKHPSRYCINAKVARIRRLCYSATVLHVWRKLKSRHGCSVLVRRSLVDVTLVTPLVPPMRVDIHVRVLCRSRAREAD